jgi:hypothetical protein
MGASATISQACRHVQRADLQRSSIRRGLVTGVTPGDNTTDVTLLHAKQHLHDFEKRVLSAKVNALGSVWCRRGA